MSRLLGRFKSVRAGARSNQLPFTQGRSQTLAPCWALHTSGPRDVPRCGALSFLQSPFTTGGIQKKPLLRQTKKMWVLVVVRGDSRAAPFLKQPSPRKFGILLNDLKPTWLFSPLYFAPCRPLGQCAPLPQACRHTPAPGRSAGGPRRVFCRRRQRYKHASVAERPPQSYGQRLELVEGASARGLTFHCSGKAGYIWPDSVKNPFYSTSGIFKPISGLCRSH